MHITYIGMSDLFRFVLIRKLDNSISDGNRALTSTPPFVEAEHDGSSGTYFLGHDLA